jgi:hypothetical protein
MKRVAHKFKIHRSGVITVLAAVMLVILLAMIAFAVDLGYVALARTQLQTAADTTALAAAANVNQSQASMVATAQYFGSQQTVAGRPVQVNSTDILYGNWNASSVPPAFTRSTPSTTPGNAVQVTVWANQANGGQTPLFFGRLLGVSGVNESASAVATMNPRDIAFVIDLSGSMNDDTSPDSSTSSSSLMQTVYTEFNFGTYPGTSQKIASALGGTTFSGLKSTSGLLHTKLPSSSPYYIASNASSSTCLQNAASYLMAVQMASIMPNAIPTPNSSNATSRAYWANFFTYLDNNSLQLGYGAYLQYMMHYGRDVPPDGADYTPLSLSSNLCACPLHSESVGGASFSFPPDEMPTHAARSALIAAIQVVQSLNQGISDPNQMDWVSIVTFDTTARIQQTLTSNYTTTMNACTQLQACSDTAACTNTEAGLALAYSHIGFGTKSGNNNWGRQSTNKVVVLLTDGQPNLQQSSNSTISTYRTAHPSSNFYGGSGDYPQDAALMQTSIMQGKNWYLYPVGVGLDCDYDFMDRMARMGSTANTSGQAPRGSGDPSVYQTLMVQIFKNIITNPKLRLVK